MNNMFAIFTVQMPEAEKPIVYARTIAPKHRKNRVYLEAVLTDWIEDNDVPEATEEEISDLAWDLATKGYARWDDTICFEITECENFTM